MAKQTKADDKWIQDMNMNKGALHQDLGVAEGEKIPLSKLKHAAKNLTGKTARRAQLALTMRGFNHVGDVEN